MVAIATNDQISKEIKEILQNEKKVKEAICNQLEGELKIFIREGHVQKVRYQRDYMLTQADSFFDDEDEEFNNGPVQLISDVIYKRFTYLVASSILNLEVMDYGHLNFKYSFVESNANIEIGNLAIRFDGEVHIPKNTFKSYM